MNGGTCKDKLNGYECQCPSAYTGETCQGKFSYILQFNQEYSLTYKQEGGNRPESLVPVTTL